MRTRNLAAHLPELLYSRCVALLALLASLLLPACGDSTFQPSDGLPVDESYPGVFADETSERLPAVSNVAVRAAGGDIDNDGDVDIVVTTGPHTGTHALPPENMVLQINDGQGVFTNEANARLPAAAFGPQHANAAILGDVDGDADLDIFVANGVTAVNVAGYQDWLWLNDGFGNFTDVTATNLPVNSVHCFDAAFLDVDTDGDLDVFMAVTDSLGTSGQNRLLVNDGAGVFSDETALRLPALQDVSLAVAIEDLDGDGDADIVVANATFGGSKILVNNGVGFFADESTIRFLSFPPSASDVIARDLNGDDSPDLVFASHAQDAPAIFINSGAGFFTEESIDRTPVFVGTHGVAVADVDTDGDEDIFVTVTHERSRLLLNDGTGVFEDATETNLPIDSVVIRYPEFVDVDSDGDADLYLPESIEGGLNQDLLWINLGRPQ